jgi:hypothetical protein
MLAAKSFNFLEIVLSRPQAASRDNFSLGTVIYEPSARRHFSHISALFEAQATKSECFMYANVPNTSSRIEVCIIFFETNISILKLFPIVSNLVNRWRLFKCQSN